MIKESTYQLDISILNVYRPQIKFPKYIKKKLIDLKGRICNQRFQYHHYNNLQNYQTENVQGLEYLKNTFNSQDLLDIQTTPSNNNRIHKFTSGPYCTLTSIDQTMGHKTNLNKFQRIKMVQIVFSGHKIKLKTSEQKQH